MLILDWSSGNEATRKEDPDLWLTNYKLLGASLFLFMHTVKWWLGSILCMYFGANAHRTNFILGNISEGTNIKLNLKIRNSDSVWHVIEIEWSQLRVDFKPTQNYL